MNTFDQKTISRYSRITGENLLVFFNQWNTFLNNDEPLISKYYLNIIDYIDAVSFDNLSYLIERSNLLISMFVSYKTSFKYQFDLELLDFLEDIRTKLEVINKYNKFLRSSKTADQNSPTIQFTYILGQNQTLEQISDQLGSLNSQNDWTNISNANQLFESQYTPNGGNSLLLNKNNLPTASVTTMLSVIDNLLGERLYGLDLDKKIEFVDEDLKVLTYKDTVIQAISILIRLSKGDVPQYPYFGVDRSIAIGSNLGSLSIPTVIRQYNEVFGTDDSLVNFNIKEFFYNNGSLFITFEVSTRYDLIYNNQTVQIIA